MFISKKHIILSILSFVRGHSVSHGPLEPFWLVSPFRERVPTCWPGRYTCPHSDRAYWHTRRCWPRSRGPRSRRHTGRSTLRCGLGRWRHSDRDALHTRRSQPDSSFLHVSVRKRCPWRETQLMIWALGRTGPEWDVRNPMLWGKRADCFHPISHKQSDKQMIIMIAVHTARGALVFELCCILYAHLNNLA